MSDPCEGTGLFPSEVLDPGSLHKDPGTRKIVGEAGTGVCSVCSETHTLTSKGKMRKHFTELQKKSSIKHRITVEADLMGKCVTAAQVADVENVDDWIKMTLENSALITLLKYQESRITTRDEREALQRKELEVDILDSDT